MTKLVIFDSDGTLCTDFDRKKYNVFIKKFLKKHIAVDSSLMKKQNRIWNSIASKVLRGKISHVDANAIWLQKLGLKKSLAREFVREDAAYWKRVVKPKAKVMETLKKIKKSGYKIAVLSNDVRQSFYKKDILSTIGIDKHVDRVFTAHSIGHAKPEKKSYMHIVKLFCAKPKETIFVGNMNYEIAGAKKAGLKTVFVGKKKCSSADFNIIKISDVMRILGC